MDKYRGYRWSQSNVKALLKAVYNRTRDNPDRFEKPVASVFYESIKYSNPLLKVYSWKSMRDKIRALKLKHRAVIQWRDNSAAEKAQSLNSEQSEEEYIQCICPFFYQIDKIFGNRQETHDTAKTIKCQYFDPLEDRNEEQMEDPYVKIYATDQSSDTKQDPEDLPLQFYELRQHPKRKIEDESKNFSSFKESINNTAFNTTNDVTNLSHLQDIKEKFKTKLDEDCKINEEKHILETRRIKHFEKMEERRYKLELKKLDLEERKLLLEKERLAQEKQIRFREMDTNLEIERMRMEREAELKKYELDLKYMYTQQ